MCVCICWRNFYRPTKRTGFYGVGWGGVGWDGNVHSHFHTYVMLRYCPFFHTSTHTWCYATARSSAPSTHTWCYVGGGVGWDGNVHSHFHTYVMLRYCPFFHTSTHTWCYATARSSAPSTHTWCYVGGGVGWGRVGWGGMVTFIHTSTKRCLVREKESRKPKYCFGTHRWNRQLVELGEGVSPKQYPLHKRSHESESQNLSICQIVPMALGTPTWVVENNCGVHQASVLIRLGTSSRTKKAWGHVAAKVKPLSSETHFWASNLTFRCGETMIL